MLQKEFVNSWKVLNVFTWNLLSKIVISAFRREEDENCALLGHYAVSSGNFLPLLSA